MLCVYIIISYSTFDGDYAIVFLIIKIKKANQHRIKQLSILYVCFCFFFFDKGVFMFYAYEIVQYMQYMFVIETG